MTGYNADSIRILDAGDIVERFDWAQAAELAAQYRRPQQWIERGLEACRRAGVERDYFIDRFLKRLPIPRNDVVDAAFRELLTER